MNDRLTMTSDKGGVAFTFDLDITCEKSEIMKILKVAQKLKEYEEIGTVEECREARERQRAKKRKLESYCGFNSYECPVCHADVNHKNNFCYKCGQRLE